MSIIVAATYISLSRLPSKRLIHGFPSHFTRFFSATTPTRMQAITLSKPGGVDVIEKTEQPVPVPRPGDALIKINYGGVNFIDTYFRKGLYPIASFPYTIGQEAGGTIVSLPTDPAVLNDEEYKKRNLKVGSKVVAAVSGAFAEYAATPWNKVFAVPDSVPLLTGVAAYSQGLTAVTFFAEAYNVKPGDVILVHTVAGGLGLLFAQLAKQRGATVIGTTSTQEKATLARAHGADHVILYPVEDTVQRVLEITNGAGVDAVFDGVGKDTWENNFKIIKRKGTIVSVGNASGAVPPFPPLKLVEKNVRLLRPTVGNYVYTAEEGWRYSTELFELLAKGTLKINIHKLYPFSAEGVQQAHTDLTEGKTTGKLVIKVADE